MRDVKIIYKITYPNGKIYVGSDIAYNINYFGSANPELIWQDFSWEEQCDFTIRNEILWESETATKSEVLKLEVQYIRSLRSNDPKIGYNRHPPFKEPSKTHQRNFHMQAPDLVRIAITRHTCKAFDPAKKIVPADMAALRTVLRYAPSSVNSQPWHFVVAESAAGKAQVVEAMHGGFAYNAPKVLNCSHAVVLCARTDLDEAHLAALLAQEEQDGRFPAPEAKATQNTARSFYVGMHRNDFKDVELWAQKQLYIALGTLLQGAGALGIDACPMEGFDQAKLDDTLGLKAKGLTAVVVVALGYRGEGDFNAKLPKSRLGEDVVFTTI
jgi:nitroreductase/dihydropteridine reductase